MLRVYERKLMANHLVDVSWFSYASKWIVELGCRRANLESRIFSASWTLFQMQLLHVNWGSHRATYRCFTCCVKWVMFQRTFRTLYLRVAEVWKFWHQKSLQWTVTASNSHCKEQSPQRTATAKESHCNDLKVAGFQTAKLQGSWVQGLLSKCALGCTFDIAENCSNNDS